MYTVNYHMFNGLSYDNIRTYNYEKGDFIHCIQQMIFFSENKNIEIITMESNIIDIYFRNMKILTNKDLIEQLEKENIQYNKLIDKNNETRQGYENIIKYNSSEIDRLRKLIWEDK